MVSILLFFNQADEVDISVVDVEDCVVVPTVVVAIVAVPVGKFMVLDDVGLN
jgi:hypothetical protein